MQVQVAIQWKFVFDGNSECIRTLASGQRSWILIINGFRARSYGKPIRENLSFMRRTGKASGALLWTGLKAKNLTRGNQSTAFDWCSDDLEPVTDRRSFLLKKLRLIPLSQYSIWLARKIQWTKSVLKWKRGVQNYLSKMCIAQNLGQG